MKISFHWPITFERENLIPLDDTNLPTRAKKALKRQGVMYLNDVDPDSDQYIQNFGKKSKQDVLAEKKRLGI